MTMDESLGSTRMHLTFRDHYDEYQDKRAIEGTLATSLLFQDKDCAAHPDLGVDNILGAAEYTTNWINPPRCLRVSPDNLNWQRKEQIFSWRGDNVMGPPADKFVADPSLGWSDVLDVKGDGGSMMRLASGVTMAPTKAISFLAPKNVVDHNLQGIVASPASAAISQSVDAMERDYKAMFERSKVGGGAAAFSVKPGAALR